MKDSQQVPDFLRRFAVIRLWVITSILGTLLFSCQSMSQEANFGRLEMLAKLPAKLNENSGLELLGTEAVWIIEDNGNKDHLYAVDLEGNIIRDLNVKDAQNEDWEDLAQDEEGNVYIGDFGNNDNKRKNLAIYLVRDPAGAERSSVQAEKIQFSYPQQKDFPPEAGRRLFDAEGFYYQKGYLYIVTKNRTRPFDGKAYFYRVPAKPGAYEAELLDSITPCTNPKNCRITAADISEDGKTLALMSYGQLFLITEFEPGRPSTGTLEAIDLKWPTQMESVCFEGNTRLLMSDEQSKTKGRYLYRLELNEPR